MSEVTRCPKCDQANRVPDLASGKKAVCGKCGAELAGSGNGAHPVDLTDANFDATISDGRPTVVDFWAAWCGPCRVIAPVLEQLASERGDIRFAKLNVDQNQRTAARFRVQGIPLLVFFRDGKESGRVVGAVPRQEIERAISEHLTT